MHEAGKARQEQGAGKAQSDPHMLAVGLTDGCGMVQKDIRPHKRLQDDP